MPCARPPSSASHPFPHLGRGLVREGDGEDLARPRLPALDQAGDAPREDAGLARARAGDDQQRRAPVLRRLALLRVEAREQAVRRTALVRRVAEAARAAASVAGPPVEDDRGRRGGGAHCRGAAGGSGVGEARHVSIDFSRRHCHPAEKAASAAVAHRHRQVGMVGEDPVDARVQEDREEPAPVAPRGRRGRAAGSRAAAARSPAGASSRRPRARPNAPCRPGPRSPHRHRRAVILAEQRERDGAGREDLRHLHADAVDPVGGRRRIRERTARAAVRSDA